MDKKIRDKTKNRFKNSCESYGIEMLKCQNYHLFTFIICKKQKIKVFYPYKYQISEFLRMAHGSGSHYNEKDMIRRLHTELRVIFPNMSKRIRKYINNCEGCTFIPSKTKSYPKLISQNVYCF